MAGALLADALLGLPLALLSLSACSAPPEKLSTQEWCATVQGAISSVPEPVSAEEAEYLEELLEHAGEPARFTSAPQSGDGGVSAYGFVPAPYNCTLHPSKVHVRTKSGEKKNVGAKPYTNCDKAVSTIKQWSTLYIVEWAGTYYRPMLTDVYAVNNTQKTLNQQNVQYFCKNNNNSLYMQTTKGEIIINTKYYSVVSSELTPLACGY